MRTIYLPAIERRVSIGQYVQAIKLAKQYLDREFKHGLNCWWPCSGQDIVNQFRDSIQDRINQAIPYIARGQQ